MALMFSEEEFNALDIPETVDPVQFVQNEMKVPSKSNVMADIDLELTPYLKEPISCIVNRDIDMIIVVAPTQSGKTVILQAKVAYMIGNDPGPVLYIYPTEDTAKKAVKEKLIGMIQETRALHPMITGNLDDISKSAIGLKNMTIYPGWAGGAGSLSSYPMKTVIWDEVRLMPLEIGDDSNAIKLGEDRMTTFHEYGLAQGLMVSSPSVEGDLLHRQLYKENTTIFRWHVPCPDCGKYQELSFWKNIVHPEKISEWHDKNKINMKIVDDKKVHCLCIFCGAEFTQNNMKREWNNKGVYAPEGAVIEPGGHVPGKVYSKRVVFWWNSLVSPFRSFEKIWNEFLQTKDEKIDYKNFIQAWLAEFWKVMKREREWEVVGKALKVQTPEGYVPGWAVFLTAGVDVQQNFLYYIIRAWGPQGKSRLVQNRQITSLAEFEQLLINQKFPVIGKDLPMQVTLIGIDSGYKPKEVYSLVKFINGKYGEKCRAIKGMQNMTAPFKATLIEHSGADGTPVVGGIYLWLLKTNYWKEFVTGKWDIPTGNPGAWELHADVAEDYLRQITAEALVERTNAKGRKVSEWCVVDKIGNHYFDCECIASAMAEMCGLSELSAIMNAETLAVNEAKQQHNAGPKRERPGTDYDFGMPSGEDWLSEGNDFWG